MSQIAADLVPRSATGHRRCSQAYLQVPAGTPERLRRTANPTCQLVSVDAELAA